MKEEDNGQCRGNEMKRDQVFFYSMNGGDEAKGE